MILDLTIMIIFQHYKDAMYFYIHHYDHVLQRHMRHITHITDIYFIYIKGKPEYGLHEHYSDPHDI